LEDKLVLSRSLHHRYENQVKKLRQDLEYVRDSRSTLVLERNMAQQKLDNLIDEINILKNNIVEMSKRSEEQALLINDLRNEILAKESKFYLEITPRDQKIRLLELNIADQENELKSLFFFTTN